MRPSTKGCIFNSGPSQESGEGKHSDTTLSPITAEVYDQRTDSPVRKPTCRTKQMREVNAGGINGSRYSTGLTKGKNKIKTSIVMVLINIKES